MGSACSLIACGLMVCGVDLAGRAACDEEENERARIGTFKGQVCVGGLARNAKAKFSVGGS